MIGNIPNQQKKVAYKRPMKKKPKFKAKSQVFKISYLIYVAILAALIIAALIYVNSVLDDYEAELPQRDLESVIETMKKEAKNGKLWKKDGAPNMVAGEFEQSTDPKKDFIKKLNGDIKFSNQMPINETDCMYGVLHDDIMIAEVILRKVGEPRQELMIIPIQKYDLVSYRPVSHTYTIEIPSNVTLNSEIFIKVNGIELTEEHGQEKPTGETVFTLENLYSVPKIEIKDANGNVADYKLPDSKDGKIEFDNTFYTLTIPTSLTVNVDGKKLDGETTDDGRMLYNIRLAKKAKVEITDLFGNTVEYTGTTSVPVLCYTFKTGDKCTVTVDGKPVPEGTVKLSEVAEYANFAEYAPGLPKISEYSLVILMEDPDENTPVVEIKDGEGNVVEYDKTIRNHDFTKTTLGKYMGDVPAEVASEVNVLKVLEDWSFFMSCDLNFYGLSKHLITSSHLYNVAWKYNNSIDRTFISVHGLHNPPFLEESVTNFVWLTDDCFSVDIHFIKRMIVSGKYLDDEMNERCYFVKYDATKDNIDNPTWKLVGMKEIVDNAE